MKLNNEDWRDRLSFEWKKNECVDFKTAESCKEFERMLDDVGTLKKEWIAEGERIGMSKKIEYDKEGWEEEIKQAREEGKVEMKKIIDDLIVAEILICYKENTPTSRLTSLSMKLSSFNPKDTNVDPYKR